MYHFYECIIKIPINQVLLSLLHTLILRTNEKLELIPHDLVLF